jgi:hypothetical protein
MNGSFIADVLRASFASRNNGYNWSNERKLERIEDYSGFIYFLLSKFCVLYGSTLSGKLLNILTNLMSSPDHLQCHSFVAGSIGKWSAKSGRKPILTEESSRSTYCQPQPSSSIYELPVSSSYNETRKLLVPVGVQLQQSYPRSLARFAAQLGPVAWEIASKRIERALPPGTKFGRGWVGDGEAPNATQPPVLTTSSTALIHPSSTETSSEQPTHNGTASTSHSAGPQPSSAPYASSTITTHRVNCQSLPSQQHGSVPQVSAERGEHGAEVKGNHNNLHERPAIQHTVNGFSAVSGSNIFPSAAQMVANRMQTHTAD